MSSDELKEKISIAKKAVENEPEPYKTEAFKIIFSKLLGSEISSNKKTKHRKSDHSSIRKRTVSGVIAEDDSKLLEKIDVNKLNDIRSLDKILDKILVLLLYVKENVPEYKGLTTDEIKRILGDKFGLTQITIENISMQLKRVAGKYVTRTKFIDKTVKYRYEILDEGKIYLINVIKES